jgi:hypothetical protein
MERLRYRNVFIAKSRLASPAKLFTFLLPEIVFPASNITRGGTQGKSFTLFVGQIPSDV